MKRKGTAVIGMVVCFMMMATLSWALDIPGMPNGTVTDGNLVWLKNANCFGQQTWSQAMKSAAGLKSGDCNLRDGSKAGMWRLPTKEELQARQRNQSGFNNVQSSWYWSSSTYANVTHSAWAVYMDEGYVANVGNDIVAKIFSFYVWPVRSVQ